MDAMGLTNVMFCGDAYRIPDSDDESSDDEDRTSVKKYGAARAPERDTGAAGAPEREHGAAEAIRVQLGHPIEKMELLEHPTLRTSELLKRLMVRPKCTATQKTDEQPLDKELIE